MKLKLANSCLKKWTVVKKRPFEQLAGKGIRFHYPMHRLTTYRVGGPAEALWEAKDIETLKKVVRYLSFERHPLRNIGRGKQSAG
jgi:UDP-N-acetylmuramate dehydrogenase